MYAYPLTEPDLRWTRGARPRHRVLTCYTFQVLSPRAGVPSWPLEPLVPLPYSLHTCGLPV